jgi:stearoyl-CoA desaturase (delta-9 desaturase)
MSQAIWFLVFLAIGYLINITYITVFYHRALAHGAVALTPKMRRFIAHTGIWATGLDPKGWVCMHRLHHRHSDTASDPHSPRNGGIFSVAMAQLRFYEKALSALAKGRKEFAAVVADLDFPVHALIRRRLWFIPYLTHIAIGCLIGLAFSSWSAGMGYYLGIMSHPIQGWMVNALGHAYGYRNFETDDNSRNNTLVAWIVAGEGFQNNHHHTPGSAKFSKKWWELDLGYGICRLLQAFGLVKIIEAIHPGQQPAVIETSSG